MGEPLFYLGSAFEDELKKEGLTLELREEFKKQGHPLADEVCQKVVGTEYLLMNSNSHSDSYAIREEGKSLAVYTAYVRLGAPDDRPALTAEDLYRALRGSSQRVYLDNCAIDEAVNIANAGIPSSAEGAFYVDKELVCRNCIFTELVDFSHTTFQLQVDLRGSAFQKGGEFRGTTFQESCNFDLTTFQDFARFVRATFNKNSHFSGAAFRGDALFYRAVFRSSVGFSGAEFYRHADFSEAAFHSGVVYTTATFHADADFARAQFVGRGDFTGSRIGNPMDFTDVRYWPNTIGHWWRRKLLNEWPRGLLWRTEGTEIHGRWLVRKLLSHKKYPSGPPQKATEFFIESAFVSEVSNPLFKRYVADMLFVRAFRAEYPVLAWFWQWSADYGRSLLVWAFWSALVVLFFALWYTTASAPLPLLGWHLPDWWQRYWLERGPQFQQGASAYADQPLSFWSSVYHSVVTFTTLGFGDIVADNGIARVVTTVEVILGYVMLGGLISILAHKLARRS